MSYRFIALLLALAALAVPVALAQSGDANPGIGQHVEATYTLTFTSLTNVALAGTLDVHKYTSEGDLYTAQDIRDTYAGANRYGKSVGDAFVSDLEGELQAQIAEVLARAFPDDERVVTSTVIDRDSLTRARVDDYNPPIRATFTATITRSYASLGLGDYGAPAVDAVFDAGARVRTTFTLTAQVGYDNTYVFQAPPGLAFAEPTEGAVSTDGRTFTLLRDNTLGSLGDAPVSVSVHDPAAAPPTAEAITSTITVAMGSPASSSIPVEVTVASELGAVSLADRFPGALPGSVQLDYLSADAIRALYQTGAMDEADLLEANEGFLDRIHETLNGTFQAQRPTGGISTADLSREPSKPFATAPPLSFAATASGSRALEGNDGDKLDVGLRIGAVIRVDLTLPASTTGPMTFVLSPPPGVIFTEAGPGDLSADGRTARFTVDAQEVPVTLAMRLADPPVFTGKSADLAIVVDLQDIDITIGKALGGDLGNLVGVINIQGELGVLALDDLPEDARAGFTDRATVDFLPSDGIRLAIQKNVLTAEDLAKFEAELLDRAAQDIGNALGAKVAVEGGFVDESLSPSLIAAGKLSGDEPIRFVASAAFSKPLAGAPAAEAVTALYTQTQTFSLPRLQGLDTTYKVILPPGLAVTSLDVEGGEKEITTEPDGRSSFLVTPTGDQATATVAMAVTPIFVIAKFWPVLLILVLLLVVLPASIVAMVVLRRRRRVQAEETVGGDTSGEPPQAPPR